MGTKNLLIIAKSDQCVYSYPRRKALAELAYISPDVPPNEILINVEVAFVDTSLPNAVSIMEKLRDYAREYGGIQRIIGFSCSSALNMEEALKMALKVEQAGAEFAPQFI
jgi:hypothetical protein